MMHGYNSAGGKRLVKSPKVYFTDTGLLCYLVGLRDSKHAADGYVIHPGRAVLPLGDGTLAWPLSAL